MLQFVNTLQKPLKTIMYTLLNISLYSEHKSIGQRKSRLFSLIVRLKLLLDEARNHLLPDFAGTPSRIRWFHSQLTDNTVAWKQKILQTKLLLFVYKIAIGLCEQYYT